MDTIYWPAVFWGVVGAVVVSLVALIVQELRDHARGERGDYWDSSELMWAEIDLLEARDLGNDAPR